jgi:Transposase, Mutator family
MCSAALSMSITRSQIGRRTDVVGVFPNDAALLRLAGSLLIEQNDEWLVAPAATSARPRWPSSRPPTRSRRAERSSRSRGAHRRRWL